MVGRDPDQVPKRVKRIAKNHPGGGLTEPVMYDLRSRIVK